MFCGRSRSRTKLVGTKRIQYMCVILNESAKLIPIIWANVRFSGEWKAGTKSGHGVFAVEGGSTFEGNFVNGEIEGRGSKQWADGRRYEGDFRRGEACGEGRFSSPAGESYIGTWAQNRRHGRGQLVLPNGQGTYTGEFHQHRYQGMLRCCHTHRVVTPQIQATTRWPTYTSNE